MHIVITGASSGIGEGLARYFGARHDVGLTLVARRGDVLQTLAAELPARTHVVAADLAADPHPGAWLAEAADALGPIDVLINNAGIQYVEPAVGVDDARAARMLALNVAAPMRLANAVLPTMLARRSGAIVNVASVAAITWTPGMAHYNASKSALAAWSETLRVELEGSGVQLLTVYPGPVATPMERAARSKLQGAPSRGPSFAAAGLVDRLPTGTPAELAQLIDEGLRKGTPRIIYPRLYRLARHLRGLTQWLTDRFTPRV
jgi:short-subunit dehydrogenase